MKERMSDKPARGTSPIPSQPKLNRETSPMPFERYDKIRAGMNPGEYVVMNKYQTQNPVAHPANYFFRNAMLLGGLDAGIGALYRYRQPLMKLGQKAINYVSDKFHNLYKPTNETAITVNPHNW